MRQLYFYARYQPSNFCFIGSTAERCGLTHAPRLDPRYLPFSSEFQIVSAFRSTAAVVAVPAARQDRAKVGEVLVTRIVTELVAGSEAFEFHDKGEHTLKGLPSTWHILSVALR